jgi:hypothetical protein
LSGIAVAPAWYGMIATLPAPLGPRVGIKIFVHDRTFLNLGYRYEFFFDRIKAIGDNASRGNHVFNIGIGFNWG